MSPFAQGMVAPGTVLAILVLALPCPAAEAGDPSDFEKSFAQVIVKNCVGCHNRSESRGGLDLTRKEGLFQGGDSGPAVVPGKPGESYLLERVARGSMPPKKSGRRLLAGEIAGLRAWIQAGARWPEGRVLSPFEFTTQRRAGLDWWSLQPLRRPAVPSAAPGGHNPIDAFVLARLRQHGLDLAPPVDRATYVRRATLDLLGLPPTPQEIEAFVNDPSPDAYEKLIDRLLASPHYGERWGRHWLDVARFGESDGFERDKLRDHAWRYRDYVIRSFNQDKPYTQFVREQLAGDQLRPLTHDGLVATGFLVAGPWDEIQNVAISPLERRRAHEEQMEELLSTVGQAFLGMTVHCARCHDHKFDPIPQADYYRLKAVFDGVDHGNRPVFTPEEQCAHDRLLAPIRARVRKLKESLEAVENGVPGDALVKGAGPPVLTEGRFGRALDARRGRAEAPGKPAYRKPPLTVECWARVHGKAGFNILVANDPKESADHWEIYTYAGSGEFSAYLPGYTPAEIKSGIDITDGRWHYLALVFDGRRARLFIDAHPVKDIAVMRQGNGTSATGPLSFGAYAPQKIGCDGVVDEVRISRIARAIDHVPDGPFTSDGDTVGLWHFDQLEDNRFRDAVITAPAGGRDQLQARRAALTAELRQAEGELAAQPVPLAYSGMRRQPGPTCVLLRGDVNKPGARVLAGGLSAVRELRPDLGLPADAPEGERRLRFADWVLHPDNPLTARVLVNRLWHWHFGQGLVTTPSDFGFNGGLPSHPELLDWLASEFVDPSPQPSPQRGEGATDSPSPRWGEGRVRGWTIKRMHRLIMLSATYRQSGRFDARAAEVDAGNRLLWQFAPRRLEAESVRDAMLAVSGELNPRIGGPSFRPFTVTVFNTHFYNLFDRGTPEFNRRTVYRMQINTGRDPLLDALDCPAPSLTMPSRRHTTTTLQALALMNDSFVQRQAQRFARRVRRLAGENPEAQVKLAYRLALGRSPSADEQQATAQLVQEQDLESACWVLLNASEFLYVR